MPSCFVTNWSGKADEVMRSSPLTEDVQLDAQRIGHRSQYAGHPFGSSWTLTMRLISSVDQLFQSDYYMPGCVRMHCVTSCEPAWGDVPAGTAR